MLVAPALGKEVLGSSTALCVGPARLSFLARYVQPLPPHKEHGTARDLASPSSRETPGPSEVDRRYGIIYARLLFVVAWNWLCGLALLTYVRITPLSLSLSLFH